MIVTDRPTDCADHEVKKVVPLLPRGPERWTLESIIRLTMSLSVRFSRRRSAVMFVALHVLSE